MTCLAFFFCLRDTSKTTQIAAARSGIVWLETNPDLVFDPAVPWIVHEIYTDVCPEHVEPETFARAVFEPFKQHPVESAYERLFDSNADRRVSDMVLTLRKEYYDDVLIPVLYCQSHPVATTTINRILELGTAGAYDTSHAYLALTWLHNNDCSNAALEEARTMMAQHMAQEQVVPQDIGDIYAERVAFLLYGGHGALVQEEWIHNITNAASKSGGWATVQGSDFFGTDENSHTTALATWALTQYVGICPF